MKLAVDTDSSIWTVYLKEVFVKKQVVFLLAFS